MTTWDRESKDDRGSAVQNIIDDLKKKSAARRDRVRRAHELYERRPLKIDGPSSWESASEFDEQDDPDRLCLIQSSIETAKATLYAPQKPKPQFQTLGATWAARRMAYRADRACEGILNQRQGQFTNMWALMLDMATDAMVTGTGIVHVAADRAQKRIAHEIVSCADCYVDPIQGRDPKDFFREAPISRDEAKLLYGSSIDLSKAAAYSQGSGAERGRQNEIIPIHYAWRLPYTKDKPGRWSVVIGAKEVDGGEWSCPAFPFVFLRWIPSRKSFWGLGIPDCQGAMARRVSDYDHRLWLRAICASGKRIYYPANAGIDESQLTSNEAVTAIGVDVAASGGALPQESMTPPFTDSEFNYRERNIQGFWDAVGISQVSAAARREQGISSGIGLMTLNDTKAGRQLTKGQAYEAAFVDLAFQHMWRLRELVEEDQNYAVSWPGKRLLLQIDVQSFKDLEDDAFAVSVAPASSLPHDPAGRQEMVQQLYRSGIISQQTTKRLLGWPEVDTELEVSQAETEWVDELISRYLNAEPETWSMAQYEAPERFMVDKIGAIGRFASAWFRARIDQASLPDEDEKAKADWNIKMLSRWMQECSALVDEESQKAAAAAQPAVSAGQVPPPPAPPPALPSPVS